MTGDRPYRRVLLVVGIVALVALAGCASGGGDGGAATGTGAPPAGGGGAGGNAEDGGQAQGSYYAADKRVIVRSATMSVRVKSFEKAFKEARAVARAHGGFVTDYDVESRGDWKRGTVTIRVPAPNFSATRDGVADLGTLESERVRAQDFTNQHRERKGKLAQLRERERTLERELANTSDEHERDELREDLQDVRDHVAELEARQAALERREALSTIRVTMHEPVGEKPPKNYRSSFGFGDSLLEGVYGGLAVLKATVVLTGYLVSIGLATLVLGLLGMVFYAGGLSLTRRVWPRIRDAMGLDRSTPDDVEPRSGGRDAPPPRPDDGPDDRGGDERRGR